MADGYHTPGDAFAIQIAPETRLPRAVIAAARSFLSLLLGLRRLERLYHEASVNEGHRFEARVLRTLGVRVAVHATENGFLPPAGALIVAANHPTGALDGLVLAEAVRQVRADVRIVTNHLLARIPDLHESCFFVDPFGGATAAARSRAGLRAAHLWLRQGGALVMFPAGEVAWRFSGADDHGGWPLQNANPVPMDSPWHNTIGRLALATGATMLPAYIDARNSRLFYLAGKAHPTLRTALLGHQLLNKRGASIRVFLGAPMNPGDGAEAVTQAVRRQVDKLGALCGERSGEPQRVSVDPPVDPLLLEGDIRTLPAEALLLTSGAYDVFCTSAERIPHVLSEIGRLRELTFRVVGEGTGRSTDIDRFDRYYDHLFVWHRANRQVVGAYRVGPTDRLIAAQGLNGLYTRTLFRYDERMLDRMGPALELGRSFVREEYQRSFSALLLLWKGIGQLVVRAPQYRVLFGCVSISSRYRETSQQLLRAFLAQERLDASLAELVEAVNPPSPIRPPAREAGTPVNADELDTLIARIEGQQGMPVLLRQYLKLNATLLGFNVDPAFGDALDALMMVDLSKLPMATLQRYLGKTAAAQIASRAPAAA